VVRAAVQSDGGEEYAEAELCTRPLAFRLLLRTANYYRLGLYLFVLGRIIVCFSVNIIIVPEI
jgi:hypothetical protein